MISNLIAGVFQRSIPPTDAFNFILARLARKPTNINFSGISFENADLTLWSLIAEIFVNKAYTNGAFRIKENDVVVDIGAHKGVFVAYAAQITHNKIIAFEPDDENFSHMKSLIAKNNWKHVDPVNVAIAGVASPQVELYSGISSSRHTLLGKDVVTGSPLSRSKLVKAITLEQALNSLNSVDLLKMDCEGAEFSIISSTEPAIFNKVKRIVLEYHAPLFSKEVRSLATKLRSIYQEVEIIPAKKAPLGKIYARM